MDGRSLHRSVTGSPPALLQSKRFTHAHQHAVTHREWSPACWKATRGPRTGRQTPKLANGAGMPGECTAKKNRVPPAVLHDEQDMPMPRGLLSATDVWHSTST